MLKSIPEDAFADLAEVFAPAQKKDPSTKSAKDMPGAVGLPGANKNKPVIIILSFFLNLKINLIYFLIGCYIRWTKISKYEYYVGKIWE